MITAGDPGCSLTDAAHKRGSDGARNSGPCRCLLDEYSRDGGMNLVKPVDIVRDELPASVTFELRVGGRLVWPPEPEPERASGTPEMEGVS